MVRWSLIRDLKKYTNPYIGVKIIVVYIYNILGSLHTVMWLDNFRIVLKEPDLNMSE